MGCYVSMTTGHNSEEGCFSVPRPCKQDEVMGGVSEGRESLRGSSAELL
jgi:hypothetical protein